MRVARVPPWKAKPAGTAMDWMSPSGAEHLAGIIRERWASVGVQARVAIQTVEVGRRRNGHRRVEHVVRLDMPGGVPW